MPKPVFSTRNDERLLDLAAAIADGMPIDWATATPADSAAVASSVVVRLQQLERLVRGHEAIRSRSNCQSAPAGHETVLTEARRNAEASPGDSLQVRWGPLVVLEKIGRGSFGDVYRAWDPRLDREVALKLVPEHTSDSAGSPVVEEGRLLARVRHPNVLTVHGAERIDGRVGIWTEYVRGETLAEEIARRGPVSPDEATRIGIDVCRALGAVHAAGLLHRDVKAQNILRDATGRIVLGDFGTGVEFDEHAVVADSQVAGTPLYLAPEIFARQPATVASDVYGLGVLLYFLVTGTYPVRGSTLADIRRAHAEGERVSLRTAAVGLPQPFVDVVETLLHAQPDARFQTAAVAESALAKLIGNSGESRDTSVSRRWPSFQVGVAAAVVISVLLGAAAFALVKSHWQIQAGNGAPPQSGATPLIVGNASGPPVVPAPTATATAPPPPTTRLSAGDWILVARFDNRTGEAVLDGTIEAALKRELEYSEYVRVAQRDRWEDVFRLLGRPLDTPLDPKLAREVSLRDGSIRGLITGRVEKTESRYAISSTIVNPATGTALATITEEASNHAQLLSAVRRQALRLRGAVGEGRAALERTRKELESVPIPSLEAVSFHAKALAQGGVRDQLTPTQARERWAGVERLVRNALREDPTFAHAWIMLAYALSNQGRPREEYLQYARRAVDLAGTATPQERYFIIGSFHGFNAFWDQRSRNTDNPHELEQARSAYEALFTLQPDHYYVQNNLRSVYLILGRDHEATHMWIRQAEARPANFQLNVMAASALVDEGNLPAALGYAARAEAAAAAVGGNVADQLEMELFWAYLDWFEEKPRESLARANRLAAIFDRLPTDLQWRVSGKLTFLYLALGRLKTARELAERCRVWEGERPYLLAYALREQGDLEGLHEYLTTRWTHDQSSRATADGWRVEFLALVGMLEEAERDIERYRGGVPTAIVETSFYPFLMGQLELSRGRPDEAARLLQAWLVSRESVTVKADQQPVRRHLAEAWEALGDVPSAIAVLEKAVEHRPGLGPQMIGHHIWIINNAQLARLYRENGQGPKARVIEERLRRLLAVADPDDPLLVELRARQ